MVAIVSVAREMHGPYRYGEHPNNQYRYNRGYLVLLKLVFIQL
jgi:hypothetical protein